MSVCLIGLGSNEGDRRAILEAAVARLRQTPSVSVAAVSTLCETLPVGGSPGQPAYLNGALRAKTSLGPHELLACLQQIEHDLGRRRTERWGPRTIDLDLLLYDDLVLDSPSLVVPHPRMAWRRFVLEPAREVAGFMVHPVIGWTVDRLLEHLSATRPYVAIAGPIAAGKTRLAERLSAAIPARMIAEQPDWRQLDAFYANPAGHGLQVELGFLHQRRQLLAADDVGWSVAGWSVSDFWFDQSAAFAAAWLPEGQLPEYIEQYERVRRAVVRPRLVVWLDVPADELLARVLHRGRACERRLTADQLDRIRQSVQTQIGRPDQGPVLRAAGNEESFFAEVMAAVRGME